MTKVVYLVGDDVSTDVIYPGRYMATVLPGETPQYAFADDAEFSRKLKAKDAGPGGAPAGHEERPAGIPRRPRLDPRYLTDSASSISF